jgi:hypothetical protein
VLTGINGDGMSSLDQCVCVCVVSGGMRSRIGWKLILQGKTDESGPSEISRKSFPTPSLDSDLLVCCRGSRG